MPFIGERTANKVYEIICMGGLRRLDFVDKERERVLEMFQNIHGVGNVIAQQFYAQVCGSSSSFHCCSGLEKIDAMHDSTIYCRPKQFSAIPLCKQQL